LRGVEVALVRVQRQAGEPDVGGLGDGAAEAAAEHVADLEVLVEPSAPDLRRRARFRGHQCLLSVSSSTRRARSTTGRSIIAPSSAKTPRPRAAASSLAATTFRAQATSV